MSVVYLDHNATTPVDPLVLEAMLPYFDRQYGNPSSRHEFGRLARKAVDEAREKVADVVGAHPSQVLFCSGGSEANNFMLKGAASCLPRGRIAVSAVEHPSVMAAAADLSRDGWELNRLAVDAQGCVDREGLLQELVRRPALVSVMLANNETGVVQDVAAIAEAVRAQGALMHTDAVQALGKMKVDFRALYVHAMTLSAHKINGPKGVGALVIDKRVELRPMISGGGQEKGLRAGTENVAAIVGFGVACELARRRGADLAARKKALREQLERGLAGLGVVPFGVEAERLPNTTYFSFPGIEGETLVMELDRLGFAVASGSACSSGSTDPSPVLLAMGVQRDLARGAVRVSIGQDNTEAEIDALLSGLRTVVERLGKLSAVAV